MTFLTYTGRVSMERTREDIAKLRVDFAREPRGCALKLAQKLSWHSMELALANDHAASEATWSEALRVASHVLNGPQPSQLERTELIRIGVGTARSMLYAGKYTQAMGVLDNAEAHYAELALAAKDPVSVLALRGAILTVRAECLDAMDNADAALDTLCEALLELAAGSEANPLIVKAMIRQPLGAASALLQRV